MQFCILICLTFYHKQYQCYLKLTINVILMHKVSDKYLNAEILFFISDFLRINGVLGVELLEGGKECIHFTASINVLTNSFLTVCQNYTTK